MTSSHPSLDEQGDVFVRSSLIFFSLFGYFLRFSRKKQVIFFVRCVIFISNIFDLSVLLYIVALYIVAFCSYNVAFCSYNVKT